MMLGRQISEHFNEDELRCRCGCGAMPFTDQAVVHLERLRCWVDFPMKISSGYRCPVHNAEESTTGEDGPHTIVEGDNITVDVRAKGWPALKLVAFGYLLGFRGIGLKQHGPHSGRFVHLDRLQTGRHPRPWVWTYGG